jgi:hypothetical protein
MAGMMMNAAYWEFKSRAKMYEVANSQAENFTLPHIVYLDSR